MKKLFLSFLLTLPHILATAETVEINGIRYFLDPQDKEALVTQKPYYSGDIVIPASVTYNDVKYRVTSIGEDAFAGCSGMTSISIPQSVTSIGNYAFIYCSGLTSVSIPNSVTSIGRSAFQDCSGLTSVSIPNSVTSIGTSAFSGCSGLTSVHISSLKVWCGIDFYDYLSNPLFYAHNLYLNGEKIKDLVIPNSATTISSYAFYGCSGLTSVTIPNSVTSINSQTFFDCSGLTFVTIPNSVTSIANSAFHGCRGLTSITIPNSVTSIGTSAFSGCSGLTSVIIPNSVTSIDINTFDGCISLASVIIPNSVTSIEFKAFDYCSGLTSVTIGSGVKFIREEAFANCDELTDIYCLPEKLSNEWNGEGLYTQPDVFKDSYPQAITLHVPAASIEAYRSTTPWSQFKAIVALEDGDIPKIEKCATPEITYANGNLNFTCETEGVEFVSDVIVEDAKKYYDASVTLSQTYNITVYATKVGYENSDVATASLCWIGIEPKTEGITNKVASVRAQAVLIQTNGNQLTISGADEGTVIYVYDTSGNQVGYSKASAGTTTIKTSLRSGEIGIVKIGDRSVKVLMK